MAFDPEMEEPEVLQFEDEEGSMIEMIVIQRFEVEAQTYVQVLDRSSEEGDIYVFRQTNEDGETSFEQIEDEDEWVRVVDALGETEDV